jgi:hypothetical protein
MAQMTPGASFGPVIVVVAHSNPPRAFIGGAGAGTGTRRHGGGRKTGASGGALVGLFEPVFASLVRFRRRCVCRT